MPTASSGASPYCSVTQFLDAVDERSVRQLVSDVAAPVTGSLEDNAVLAFVLGAASGEVEASATTGSRYVIDETRNDLAGLTGNSALYLAEMVAVLAYTRLYGRRPNQFTQPHHRHKEAQEFLEQLRLGERVFGVLENQQAGSVSADAETPAAVERRKGVVIVSDRLFGSRVNRLPRS